MNARVRKFPTAGGPLWLSAEHHVVVITKLLQHPRLIEPCSSDEVSIAVQQDPHKSAAFTQIAQVAIHDASVHRLFPVLFQAGDWAHVSKVVDAVRHMQQQVQSRLDSQFCQQRSPPRSDARYKLHGGL